MKGETLYKTIGGIDEKWLKLADEPEKTASEKRFIGYELKKLFGVRYLWIFLAVLLLLNSGTAFYTASKTAAANEPSDMIAEFFELYFDNPDELDAHYDEILAFNEEQNRLFMEAMHNGDVDYEGETMPSVYSSDESYPDSALFGKLYSAIEAARAYPDVMQRIINSAEANLSEFEAMGISPDSFTYKYQLRVIELYKLTRDNVNIGVEYTRGWDEYFSYDLVDVFIFIMLIMLGSLVFAQEKQSGFLPVLRSAKNGRGRTAAAKVLTMLLLSSAFTLLFTFTTWAAYGLCIGFSSPANALQSLDSFTLSSSLITIGEYFAITVGVKLLVFALFSTIILALSAIFYNYVLIYISGLGFFGLNFLLYTLSYINASNPFKNLNLVAVSAVNPLFVRYRAINLFGAVCGYVPFMLTVFAALILAFSALAIRLYIKGGSEIRPAWLDTLIASFIIILTKLKAFVKSSCQASSKKPRTPVPQRPSRSYLMSLIAAESFKTLVSSRFILVVIALLCVKVWYSSDVNAPSKSYSDAVYKEYMTTLEGELTDEKLQYLADERAMINETIAAQSQMQRDYMDEKITLAEYREYLSDYNYAYSRSELLTVIEEHASYLRQKEEDTGVKGWFVYDTGWKKLFSSDADLFLYTAVLLLLTGSFASEYASKSSSGGFAQILRSTRNGRNRTFRAKLFSAGFIAASLSALFNLVDLAVIFKGYSMPDMNAPLLSIETFGSYGGSMTVTGYLCVFLLLRLAASVMMATLVCALSELLCKYLPVLGSAIVLTMLPALCVFFGFAAADKINFLNLLAGTPLFLESNSASMFGSGWAMLALWIAAAAIAVGAMTISAKKMFER